MLILYIFPLIISAVFGILLAYYISRYVPTPGALPLIALMLAASIWSGGYALEIALPDPAVKLFWARFEYLGIVAIAPSWAIFCARYLDSPTWLSRSLRNQLLLGVLPAITLVLVMSNRLHGLVWTEVGLRTIGSVQILEYNHGPWFSVYLAYTYSLLILSSIWLGARLVSSSQLQRSQIGMALLASLVPLLGNLIYVSPVNPVPGLDWTPFSFTVAGLLFAFSLFRYKLMKIVPIAHQAMFERLEDVILVLDAQSRVIDMNPAAERLLATPGWRTSPPPLAKVFPGLAAEVASRMDPQKTMHMEVTLGSAPDRHDYEVRVTPLSDRFIPIVGRLVSLHDVTQRRQEKELLRRARDELEVRVAERTEELKQANEQILAELAQRSIAEKKFQEIVELAPDAMLLVDTQGQIVLANAQAERMFGCAKEILYKRTILSLLPESVSSRYHAHLEVYTSRPIQNAMQGVPEMYGLRVDGSEFPIEISTSPLNTADGLLVACVIRDISERKHAEQALRESENTYRALFEKANDAIFLLTPDGVFWQVNQKAADLLGYTQEEILKKDLAEIVAPGEVADARRKIRELLNGKSLPIYERYFRKKDGTVFPVEINIALVRDVSGKPKFIQSIARDITGRKAAEQEQMHLLEEVSQSQEQMRALAIRLQEVQEFERRQIATELHDRVGQNLTGLNLNLQIIQNQAPPECTAAMQNRLEDSLRLVEETTRQVRDVMADLVPPLLDEFGLVSAMRWYSGEFSRRTGLNTQVVGQDEPRLGRGTEVALFRIIQEALNNIARHAKATQVTITFENSEGYACLKVEDNGQGFDPNVLSTVGEFPHLGLVTMKERAVSIGGQLSVQSGPGKGTMISVEIGITRNDN